jgi:RNA polymerase sigma factor (sigma-70 family)
MAECDSPKICERAMENEEAALVSGLREASPEAHAALYRRFAAAIFQFAGARLAGDSALAEEIVVLTFVDGARNIARFNARKSSLSAWLYGIARRHIHNEIRNRLRLKSVPSAKQVSLEVVAETCAAQDLSTSVSARLDAQRQFAILAAHLTELEMEALILQHIDQLSLKEIGQTLGRSERAVHSLLHRARQKARERLSQNEA